MRCASVPNEFLNFTIIDVVTFIVALFALFASILANKKQERSIAPYCRIKASSRKYTFKVRIENVGTGIMKINKVYYVLQPSLTEIADTTINESPTEKVNSLKEKYEKSIDNTIHLTKEGKTKGKKKINAICILDSITNDMPADLTKIFRLKLYGEKNFPYLSQTGVNLTKDCVSPDSTHYLYKAEYISIEELNKAWEFIKELVVFVDYYDANDSRYLSMRDFKTEYESFKNALDTREDFNLDTHS